jgi:hypothetical protein
MEPSDTLSCSNLFKVVCKRLLSMPAAHVNLQDPFSQSSPEWTGLALSMPAYMCHCNSNIPYSAPASLSTTLKTVVIRYFCVLHAELPTQNLPPP